MSFSTRIVIGIAALSATTALSVEPVEAPRLPEGAKAYCHLHVGCWWVVPDRRPAPVPADLGTIVVPEPDPLTFARLQRKQEARQRFREKMLQKIDFEVRAETLRESLVRLGRQIDLNLIIADQDLVDAGVDIEYKVDPFSVTDVSSEAVFNILLGPCDCVITLDRELAVMTTEDGAEEILETRVYPVADLTWKVLEDGRAVHDFKPLMSIIQNATDGPWNELEAFGGGKINVCETGGVYALAIQQTGSQHEQIAELLEELRRARGVKPGEPVLPAESQSR